MNLEVEISVVEYLPCYLPGSKQNMQGVFSSTPSIKDRTFDSPWFLAKGTLISVSAIALGRKNGGRVQEKDDLDCTANLEISIVEFLAIGET